MSELNIHSAVAPRELMSKAVSLLNDPALAADDPVRLRWVIQPGRLWERDLRRRLADRGIAACLTFGSLRLTLERAFMLVCPDLEIQNEDQLFWVILNLLETNASNLDAIGLGKSSAPYLWLKSNEHNPSLAHVQLARMLAGILDDHATYRPLSVLKWLDGNPVGDSPDEAWIAPLVKAVWGGEKSVHPLALMLQEFIRRLSGSKSERPGFPSLILAVLTGAQPKAYLEALGALTHVCPVHLLVLETCERGLSDQMTTWRDVRAKWKKTDRVMSLQAFVKQDKWVVPGTLQAFWGDSGIKLQQQLVELEEFLAVLKISVKEESLEASGAHSRESCLAVLQGDIRITREPRTASELEALQDESLLLINATSPLRELEGARDGIRAILSKNSSFKPSDVLMILPDSARYAPLLPAVFGSGMTSKECAGPDGLTLIPWHLADRSLRADSDTMAALQDIMDALGARITLPVFADLLAQPAIQARMGLSQGEAVELVDYLKVAGFRWGLEQGDRNREDQAGNGDGLWTLEFAIGRLAAGFAHPDAIKDPVGAGAGVTPLPAFEGLASAKLADFIAWAYALGMARCEFGKKQPIGSEASENGTWLGWLHNWVPKLLDTGGEREGQSVWISRVTRQIAEGAKRLRPSAEFSSEAFRALFTEAATAFELSLPLGQGIGGMTVASPRMARALPARLIVVVGLSDGVWPRQDLVRPRGLLRDSKQSLPGDRLRRDEDRLATLEWVLSAGKSLVLTWQGRQEQTGEKVPPSVVIGELQDICRATFEEPGYVLRELPMHGFDPGLFSSTAGASYDKIAAAAAVRIRAVRHRKGLTEAVPWDALPLPVDPWGLPGVLDFATTGRIPRQWGKEQWRQLASRLVKFWKLPCKELLSGLGIRVEDDYEMLPDREALALDSLEAWGLRDELLRDLVETPADVNTLLKARLLRAGKLPPGVAGERAFAETREVASLIIETAKGAAGETGVIIPLKTMDWTVGPCLVRVSASGLKADKLLVARIEQLALAMILDKGVACTVVGKPRNKDSKVAEKQTLPGVLPDEARTHLQQLTALALLGLTFPLPYFPATSEKFANNKSEDEADSIFWEGESFSGIMPDSQTPSCRLAFRGQSDPLALGWPESPAAPADTAWKELVDAVTLPAGHSTLFAGISLSVLGFLETMKEQAAKAREEKKSGNGEKDAKPTKAGGKRVKKS